MGTKPPLKIFGPPGKMCSTKFKTIGHILKNWAPLRKLFDPPSVPSWLQAWLSHYWNNSCGPYVT